MRAPNPRQLEAFRAVMLAGGLTAGARLLNVSQPAVSRLIRDLEEALEIPLFERGAGRLRPTLEAGRLYAAVERHFDTMRDVAETASGLRAFRLGQLRIAAAPTLSLDLMPRLIQKLLAAHPQASVRLMTATAVDVTTMVAKAEADLGVAAVAPDTPGVVPEVMPPLPAVCAMPRGHALARAEKVDLRDLDGQPFIAIGGEGIFQLRIRRAIETSGASPRTRLVAPSSATAARCVAEGIGLAVLDPFAGALVDTSRVEVRPVEPPLTYELALFRPAGTAPSPLMQSFSALLHEATASLSFG
ncbi:LysR family transcriptional regulator [Acetobacteraceae bacterium H6797]|nr:LysR family transcriptional regulator [Acetobacteraceae bacterium H6797]